MRKKTQEVSDNKLFIYGWVSNQVQHNFAAWAVDKGTGSSSDKEEYYARTYEEMSEKGLEFFYEEVEDSVVVNDIDDRYNNALKPQSRQGAGERRPQNNI